MLNKRNSSIISIFSALIMLFAVIGLSACFSDWDGGPANIVISFGGGRESMPNVNYSSTDTDTHKSLLHKIELTGAGRKYEYSFTGTTFNASIVPGDYNILVVSYQGDQVYGAGSKDITVTSGQNKVSLTMYRAYMVTFCNNETGTQTKQIVRKDNDYKVTPPDGQEWYNYINLTDKFDFTQSISNNLILYSSVPIFTNITDFSTWLSGKDTNTKEKAYKIKMNVSSLGVAGSDVGSILRQSSNANKYVSLDFSGSTFDSIVDSAFNSCSNLVNITIGNSVTLIDRSAFFNCTNLTSVTIGSGVQSIDNGAFSNCTSLKEIIINPNNSNFSSQGAVLYNKDKTALLRYAANETSFTIPNTVSEIEASAFSNCSIINTVIISNNVESIKDHAFDNCTSLTSVTIGNKVKSIGTSAFSGCSNLEEIRIPGSVTFIGDFAFASCTSLTTVIFEGSIDRNYFYNDAFSGLGDLRNKYFDANSGGPGTYIASQNPGATLTWTRVSP